MAINVFGSLRLIGATVAILGCFPCSLLAVNPNYVFTKVADTSQTFQWLTLNKLNNAGLVSFDTQLGTNDYGIYTGDGRSLTEVARTGKVFGSAAFGMVNRGQINDAGTVVFTGWSGVSGVFLNEGTTTQIATQGTTDLAINNQGSVVYTGYASSYNKLYLRNGNTTTTLVNGTAIQGSMAYPVINDSGTVAFYATNNRIYVANGSALTKIVDAGTSGLSYVQGHAMNNAGTVVFNAALNSGGFGLYEYQDGRLNQLFNTTQSPFSTLLGSAINDQGAIAFSGQLATGQVGIFTGFDPVKDEVILTGDQIDGNSIVSIEFSRCLNNSGQLAFWTKFANGEQAIYVATPVPEPSTSVFLSIGAIGLLGYARRWWKRGT
jgi:hypothetical protein